MKKWIVLILALVGAAWGFQKWRATLPKSAAANTSERPTTATVETRNIRFAVSAAGDIGPSEQVSVRPEINGKILVLPVDLGDTIKKDAVMFTLDDQDLQTTRSFKQTQIQGAKLQVEKARRDFARSQQLFADKLVSEELFEDTRTTFELAKNSLEAAEKDLHLVEYQLTKTKILAPFDCTVLTRPVSVGQAVSGSAGFNSGTEVLTIADLNQMIVNAHVNQADVTRLTTGQEVGIQIDSVPGLKIKGTVERIAPQAAIKNGVKGYAARILIKEIDPRVRPGMTANISVPVSSAPNSVSAPLAAVFTEQGERYVYVQKPGGDEFEKRNVRVGISDYDFVEVLEGLQSGEVVSLVDRATKGTGPSGVKPPPKAAGATTNAVPRTAASS